MSDNVERRFKTDMHTYAILSKKERKRSGCLRSEENVEFTRKHFTFKAEEILIYDVCNHLNFGYGIYIANMEFLRRMTRALEEGA